MASKQKKVSVAYTNTPYDFLYPHLDDPEFNIKIAQKKEFSETKYDGEIDKNMTIEEQAEKMCKLEFELAPHQLFVRNFLSFNTPYNSLLLYHGLGTGKTCSAITIAEEMREYLNQLGITQRILIVASPNVQDNFKTQLFDESKLELENGFWKMNTCVGYKLLREVNPTNMKNMDRKKIVAQIKRIIANSYLFLGYREFNGWVSKKIHPENAASMTDTQITQYQNEQIQKLFNNRLIVVDEVHNIRITEEAIDNKRVAQTLTKLAEVSTNMRLLLLSATPMFNNYKEIVWLLNLMNVNDKRPTIDIKDIFDKSGNFKLDKNGVDIGKQTLIRKMTGYISFVRGENPFTFPYRIFPNQFDSAKSSRNLRYPTKALNGKTIIQPLDKLDIYCSQVGTFQEEVYYYIIDHLKKSSMGTLKKSFENMDTFGYNDLQYPIEALNMTYPLKSFNKNTKGVAIHELVGKGGLRRVMTFTDSVSEKANFEYEPEIMEEFGRLFSPEEIGKYSSKIGSIVDEIQKSAGITIIYSQYIDGGIIPMALALEELGYSRFGETKSLFKTPPTKPTKNKYIIISGEKNLSPNNLQELNAIVDKKNKDGNIVKVALISRAGSEGLDFKNIRDIHILDPWYNTNRTEQIIGRGIRWRSHCALPFKHRNARIFIHGTVLSNMEDESVDMFVHRVAEMKALQIGNVTRVLKETAVDCILNKEQVNFTEENMNSNVKIELSNGTKLDFALGDKPYSAICDYMESCAYTCKPDLPGIFEPKVNTYDETFLNYNSDKIIQRIKDLFLDSYFYTKEDLIKDINVKKVYPIEHINYAIERMTEDTNIIITDMYNKPGNLVQIDTYLLFQPVGLKNKHVSMFERNRPFDYKREKMMIKLDNIKPDKIDEVESTSISKSKSESNITIIIKQLSDLYAKYISSIVVGRGTTEQSAFVSKIYHMLLSDAISFQSDILNNILIDYLVDYLPFEQKLTLINYLSITETLTPFESQLKGYISRKSFMFSKEDGTEKEGFIITNNEDKSVLYINNMNIWQPAEYIDKEAFFKHSTTIYESNFKRLNTLIGYIENNAVGGNIFKTVDLSIKRNKGRRCITDGKSAVIKQLNKIVGYEKFYTKEKEPKVPKQKQLNIEASEAVDPRRQEVTNLTAPQLCILLEFILRYNNYTNKDNTIWFIDTDMMKFVELKNKK